MWHEDELLRFWFDHPGQWFDPQTAFQRECRRRFLTLYWLASERGLKPWEDTAAGALALVILLDPIPRILFAGTEMAYDSDNLARRIAQRALSRGQAWRLTPLQHAWLLEPLSNAERRDFQAEAQVAYADLESRLGSMEVDSDEYRLLRRLCDRAGERAQTVASFGRLPERNAVLGRGTTAEEACYLAGISGRLEA